MAYWRAAIICESPAANISFPVPVSPRSKTVDFASRTMADFFNHGPKRFAFAQYAGMATSFDQHYLRGCPSPVCVSCIRRLRSLSTNLCKRRSGRADWRPSPGNEDRDQKAHKTGRQQAIHRQDADDGVSFLDRTPRIEKGALSSGPHPERSELSIEASRDVFNHQRHFRRGRSCEPPAAPDDRKIAARRLHYSQGR